MGRGFVSIPKDPACTAVGLSKCGNILSAGFFPLLSHSSTHVSVQSSPRNETSWRGLDRESGTAGADYTATQLAQAAPAFTESTH